MGNTNLVDLFFGFRGRLNRGKYWLAAVTYIVLTLVIALLIFGALGESSAGWVIAALLYLVMVISGVAVGIKRLHDRDKSGWWLLLFYLAPGALSGLADHVGGGIVLHLAAFALSIWAFVELGCLRGTVGPNQYGPDPLGASAPAPA